jgi:hypothetical protein
MNENSHSEEEQQERPRPRVVDKRVSARGASPPSEPAPAAPQRPEPPPAAPPSPAEPQAEGPPPADEGPGGGVWTPEREEQARRLAEEIARAPARDLVVTMTMNYVEIASVKIDVGDLAGAQMAIDALDGVIRSVGARLGDAEAPLKNVLAQLQMAYAERAAEPPPIP